MKGATQYLISTVFVVLAVKVRILMDALFELGGMNKVFGGDLKVYWQLLTQTRNVKKTTWLRC